MRYASLLSTVLLLLLFLSGISQAAGDLGQSEIVFARGLVAYQQENYARAEYFFSDALIRDPDNGSTAFFLGMSQFHQQKYEESIRSFDQAVENNETEAEVYYYRGVAKHRLGQEEDAQSDFRRASVIAPDGPLRQAASRYSDRTTNREVVRDLLKKKRWFFEGSFSTAYDSNVTLDPSDITVATLPTDQDDIQFAIDVGGGYHLMNHKKRRLTAVASYTQTIYPQLTDFSYGMAHAGLESRFRLGPFTLSLDIADKFSILGTSKYLNSLQAGPALSILAKSRFLSKLAVPLHYNTYFQSIANPAQDRDALDLFIQFSEFLFFSEQRRYVKIFYMYEKNFADGPDWDFQAHRAGAAFHTPIAWEISAYLFAHFILDKKFENIDSVFGAQRDDFHHYYGLILSRPVVAPLVVKLHYSFRQNTSNISFFEYDKHFAGVTLEINL